MIKKQGKQSEVYRSVKILTISIAAYNVEKFLDKTLSSLCHEKFSDDLEVLIIDDGSRDRTGDIAKRYERKHPRIFKYVYKENGGHGSTINKGLELATGKYFRVIDGDDYVSTEALLYFIERLKTIDEDLVISDYRCVNENGNVYVNPNFKIRGANVFSNLTDNCVYDVDDNLQTYLFFALATITIKVELLRKLGAHITENCLYVDTEYDIYAILAAQKFRYFQAPIYMYFIGRSDNSVSKKNMIKNIAMQEKVLFRLMEIYSDTRYAVNVQKKSKLLIGRISAVLCAIIRTYMLMDNTLKLIKLLDKKINDSFPMFNSLLGTNRLINAVRFGGYCLVPFIKIAYIVWLKLRR